MTAWDISAAVGARADFGGSGVARTGGDVVVDAWGAWAAPDVGAADDALGLDLGPIDAWTITAPTSPPTTMSKAIPAIDHERRLRSGVGTGARGAPLLSPDATVRATAPSMRVAT